MFKNSERDEVPIYHLHKFETLDKFRNKNYKLPIVKQVRETNFEQAELDLLKEQRRIFNAKEFNHGDAVESMKSQFRLFAIKNIHEEQNRRYLNCDIPLPELVPGNNIDPELVTCIIRCYKSSVIELIEPLNIYSFLKQFESIALEYPLTNGELNVIVYNFLNEKMKSKYESKYTDLPGQITTSKFYSNLCFVMLGFVPTYANIENRFLSYDPFQAENPNINSIFTDLSKILDLASERLIPDIDKDRKLFDRIGQLLPDYMKISWDNLQIPNMYFDGRLDPPCRDIQFGFLSRYSEIINHFLMKSKKDSTCPVHLVSRKKAARMVKKKNSKFCENCGKRGHPSNKCFLHPNPRVAEQNIKEHDCCLRCRSYYHKTDKCDMYDQESNLNESCQTCKRYGVIALHSTTVCRGVSQSYIRYLEKVRKGKNC